LDKEKPVVYGRVIAAIARTGARIDRISPLTTPLDEAHAAMQENPDDDALRLRFYERLAAVELFMLLKDEPETDKISPQVFPVEGGEFVLVFDSEARLVDFSGEVAPFAAMSGRAIVEMLMSGGDQIGLGVNLGVASSGILIGADGVRWLAGILANQSEQKIGQPVAFHVPVGMDESFLHALEARLATATGLAAYACLVGVEYKNGANGSLLAFVGSVNAAKDALQKAVAEVVSFSANEMSLDVGFFALEDAVVEQITRVGLRIDIPAPVHASEIAQIKAPGMDPDAPPKLR
jgi:hypothetical protein